MQCSIVLLYYKDPLYTERALRSIHKHTGDVSHEVIVVCNRFDDAIQTIIQKHGIRKFCALSMNAGFSRGNNVGFQLAEGEFSCVFNDDLEVLTDGWLSRMLAPFSDPEIGATAVEINRITYIKGQCSSRNALQLGMSRDDLRKVGFPFYAVGCLAAYRTRDLNLIGGFDPLFTPCSWEDVDLSYRLGELLGRKISLVDGIEWNHPYRVSHGRGTVEYLGRTEEIAAIASRNQALGYDRWFNQSNE